MEEEMPRDMDVREVYRLLEQGKGWGLVNRKNVGELITIAIEKQNARLERELTNWR